MGPLLCVSEIHGTFIDLGSGFCFLLQGIVNLAILVIKYS